VIRLIHVLSVSKVNNGSIDIRMKSMHSFDLADDCDPSPMSKFTVDYSRLYQVEQDCQCDNDHDRCSLSNIMVSFTCLFVCLFVFHFRFFLLRYIAVCQFTIPPHGSINDMLKRSRRVRRVGQLCSLTNLSIG
jgi:hypothetical protein